MAPSAISPPLLGKAGKSDPRPIPKVPDLDCRSYTSGDALVHDIIEGVKGAGLCVVRQIIKPDILAKIGAEMKQHVPQAASTPGEFWPRETRKISSLLSKSETYALNLVGNPVWQKVGEYFLTSTLEDYWVSEKDISKPNPLDQSPSKRKVVEGEKKKVLTSIFLFCFMLER